MNIQHKSALYLNYLIRQLNWMAFIWLLGLSEFIPCGFVLIMEDECSTHSHNCGGRVSGVVFNMRNSVLKPPSYDPRNIVDLLDKYSDAHIIDSGWREVDTEEWVA